VLRATADVDRATRVSLRARWARELAVAVGPWILLLGMVVLGVFTQSTAAIGLALVAAGGGLFVKQLMRYPLHGHQPVEEITSLLEHLEAGPIAGIPVEVRGQVVGRGTPGYLLSPDMVIQDQSGFVPLLYRQPLPFVRALFGLRRIQRFMGQSVVARGWYHRTPGPVIELRDVRAEDGRSARTWWFQTTYAFSGLLLAVGLVVALLGIAA
jgi:hypothetical protein